MKEERKLRKIAILWLVVVLLLSFNLGVVNAAGFTTLPLGASSYSKTSDTGNNNSDNNVSTDGRFIKPTYRYGTRFIIRLGGEEVGGEDSHEYYVNYIETSKKENVIKKDIKMGSMWKGHEFTVNNKNNLIETVKTNLIGIANSSFWNAKYYNAYGNLVEVKVDNEKDCVVAGDYEDMTLGKWNTKWGDEVLAEGETLDLSLGPANEDCIFLLRLMAGRAEELRDQKTLEKLKKVINGETFKDGKELKIEVKAEILFSFELNHEDEKGELWMTYLEFRQYAYKYASNAASLSNISYMRNGGQEVSLAEGGGEYWGHKYTAQYIYPKGELGFMDKIACKLYENNLEYSSSTGTKGGKPNCSCNFYNSVGTWKMVNTNDDKDPYYRKLCLELSNNKTIKIGDGDIVYPYLRVNGASEDKEANNVFSSNQYMAAYGPNYCSIYTNVDGKNVYRSLGLEQGKGKRDLYGNFNVKTSSTNPYSSYYDKNGNVIHRIVSSTFINEMQASTRVYDSTKGTGNINYMMKRYGLNPIVNAAIDSKVPVIFEGWDYILATNCRIFVDHKDADTKVNIIPRVTHYINGNNEVTVNKSQIVENMGYLCVGSQIGEEKETENVSLTFNNVEKTFTVTFYYRKLKTCKVTTNYYYDDLQNLTKVKESRVSTVIEGKEYLEGIGDDDLSGDGFKRNRMSAKKANTIEDNTIEGNRIEAITIEDGKIKIKEVSGDIEVSFYYKKPTIIVQKVDVNGVSIESGEYSWKNNSGDTSLGFNKEMKIYPPNELNGRKKIGYNVEPGKSFVTEESYKGELKSGDIISVTPKLSEEITLVTIVYKAEDLGKVRVYHINESGDRISQNNEMYNKLEEGIDLEAFLGGIVVDDTKVKEIITQSKNNNNSYTDFLKKCISNSKENLNGSSAYISSVSLENSYRNKHVMVSGDSTPITTTNSGADIPSGDCYVPNLDEIINKISDTTVKDKTLEIVFVYSEIERFTLTGKYVSGDTIISGDTVIEDIESGDKRTVEKKKIAGYDYIGYETSDGESGSGDSVTRTMTKDVRVTFKYEKSPIITVRHRDRANNRMPGTDDEEFIVKKGAEIKVSSKVFDNYTYDGCVYNDIVDNISEIAFEKVTANITVTFYYKQQEENITPGVEFIDEAGNDETQKNIYLDDIFTLNLRVKNYSSISEETKLIVKLPFDVIKDGGILVKSGDEIEVATLLPAVEGEIVPENKEEYSITFRLPVYVKEDEYTNGGKAYLNTEETDTITLDVKGKLYNLTVTALEGDEKWSSVITSEHRAEHLPIGQASEQPKAYNYGIKLGSTFLFRLNTKGEKSDSLVITPIVKYYDKDGNLVDGANLYYNVAGKGEVSFNEYADLKLSTTLNKKARLTPTVITEFANATGLSLEAKHDIGNIKELTLRSGLRLPYVGYKDEEIPNIGNNSWMGSSGYPKYNEGYKNAKGDECIKNTFHWYGEYKLPASLVAKTKKDGKELKDGYFVVFFNIKSKSTGNDYLGYGKDVKDQWTAEVGKPEFEFELPKSPYNTTGKEVGCTNEIENGYLPVAIYQAGVRLDSEVAGSH